MEYSWSELVCYLLYSDVVPTCPCYDRWLGWTGYSMDFNEVLKPTGQSLCIGLYCSAHKEEYVTMTGVLLEGRHVFAYMGLLPHCNQHLECFLETGLVPASNTLEGFTGVKTHGHMRIN